MARRKKKKYTRKKQLRQFGWLLGLGIFAFVYLVNRTPTSFRTEYVENENRPQATRDSKRNPILPEATPEAKTLLNSYPKFKKEKLQIVQHKTYALGYSEKYEQALWVQYELTARQLRNKRVPRSHDFRPDPKVETKSATPYDYSHSHYDRGHLLPSADRRFSYEAQSETFFMSNMSPQLHSFNSGIWNFLEQQVRRWAKKEERLLVITGPAFIKIIDTIGKETKIPVPSHFYKIIVDLTPPYKAIAFLIPHRNRLSRNYFDYQVSINEIEEKLNAEFLPALSPSLKKRLKNQKERWEK